MKTTLVRVPTSVREALEADRQPITRSRGRVSTETLGEVAERWMRERQDADPKSAIKGSGGM